MGPAARLVLVSTTIEIPLKQLELELADTKIASRSDSVTRQDNRRAVVAKDARSDGSKQDPDRANILVA